MSKKLTAIAQFAKSVAMLSFEEKQKIVNCKDDDLPKVLEELGISLPSSSWWLVALKIILYGLGLVLAGVGTTAAAQTLVF